MVENVVDVRAELEYQTLGSVKVFVHAEVHPPCSRPPKQVALGNIGIAEYIGAYRRWTEGGSIKNCPTNMLTVGVVDHRWAIRRFDVEVADGVHGRNSNIARFNRIAIVANPERREPGSRFRKHVKRGLPAAYKKIRPARHRGAILPPSANRQIVNPVRHYAMLRNVSVRTVVAVRRDRIISNAAKAGVAGIQTRRFLIEIGIGNAQQQTVRVPMLESGLESVGLRVTIISVAQ